ncbi:uncharacterized protein LOC107775721 [Nicotiana tabacum]|uniref:Uncharacterized protein LOC107775721 n=1 Tax=Nicotiana tabacum TaxID=4097 RepID=A0A1S3YFS3_TOBAC|nr:PREDICTED: uncharacterized protein LOC107775721 [Nicotiana tabacum]
MMSLKMGSVSYNQQNNHGIMVEQNQDSLCTDSSSEVSSNFSSSADDELFGEEEGEEGNFYSSSSDPTSPNSSGSSSHERTTGALQNMSSLLQKLPFKRGLSKHYNGKSQSFTSLSNVSSLEDLAKPENPYNKKLKSCKSYGVFLEGFKSDHHQSPPTRRGSSSSKLNSKKTNRVGSYSSLRGRRNGSFLGNNNRPPVPPHRSTSFTNPTPLFA